MELIFDDRALVLCGEKNVLLVSDIHLGYEEALEQRGVSIPSQHPDMLNRLKKLIDKHVIDTLYILGDVKHAIGVDSKFNWQVIPEFMEELVAQVKTVVVPGNHDGDILAVIPRNIVVADIQGTVFTNRRDTIGLIHGHAWPSETVLNTDLIVMGHNHPTIRRKKRVTVPDLGRPDRARAAPVIPVVLRTSLNRSCVRKHAGLSGEDERFLGLVILPSFNTLLSGIPINRHDAELQGPFYSNGCIDFLHAEVLSAQGIYLGTVQSLRDREQR